MPGEQERKDAVRKQKALMDMEPPLLEVARMRVALETIAEVLKRIADQLETMKPVEGPKP
jgi:hypothetical protein